MPQEIDEQGLSEVCISVEEVCQEVEGTFRSSWEGTRLGKAGKEELVFPYLEENVIGADPIK